MLEVDRPRVVPPLPRRPDQVSAAATAGRGELQERPAAAVQSKRDPLRAVVRGAGARLLLVRALEPAARPTGDDLGFGHIVASEIEAPIILANLV